MRGEASSSSGARVEFVVNAYNTTGTGAQQPRQFSCDWVGNTQPVTGSGKTTVSASFPIGRTAVTCITGGSETPVEKVFYVEIVDTKAPTFTGVPAPRTVEATSSAGATVTYAVPTASDLVDGSRPVGCTPPSGSTFPIGLTAVVCSSVDTRGNRGTAEFTITVRDTTPPSLNVPGPLTLTASSSDGVPATDVRIQAFLNAAWAVDAVDPMPSVRAAAPLVFPVGTTDVVFAASDRFGNTTSGVVKVTVSGFVAPPAPPPPPPSPGRPSDTTPPSNVSAFSARAQARSVTLAWALPTDDDLAGVEVSRTPRGGGQVQIYSGTATGFIDRGVRPGFTYTYLITSVDASGNRSSGLRRTVTTPVFRGLLAPAAGARLGSPPVLRWTTVVGASYYNVQLWRNGKKILSAWPSTPRLALRARWTYSGRKYRLSAGTYRWYVWPGLGSRASSKYGKLVGTRTFVMRP